METKLKQIKEELEKNPSVGPGSLARSLGVTELDVVKALDETMAKELSGDKFEEVASELSQWGTIMCIVENDSFIFEVKGEFPLGKFGHGYYNLHSNTTPIGGHLKYEDIKHIFLMKKPFMKKETRSIQFFGENGKPIFKAYVGRDEKRNLIDSQVERFENLWNKF